MRSKWLDWRPGDEIIEKVSGPEPTKPIKLVGGDARIIEKGPTPQPTKPTKPTKTSFVGFEGSPPGAFSITRESAGEGCPPLPPGVRLISYNPKSPPVAIDVCSVVTDVEKFIRAELGELNARLHSPVQTRGGWGAFTILERLRQVGVELELEPTLTKATGAQEPSKKVFRTPTGDGGAG